MPWHALDTIPFRVAGEVGAARAYAIREALLRRTLPLSRLVEGRLEPLATASLIVDGGHTAVLTAAHVLEQANIGDLAIPLPRDQRLVLLRSTPVRAVAHPRLDVALLWFGDRSVGDRLCANWVACPLRAWCGGAVRMARLFAIAGYPSLSARRADGRVYVKPVVLFTGALDPGRYAYARTAERLDGLLIHTPELDGVSGATVWAIEEEGSDEVACVLRPAAVQVAFQHGQHVRGEPIVGAAELLSRPH